MVEVFQQINQPVWSSSVVVDSFARMSSWLDAGERRSFEAAARLVHSGRVLDIGVGAGRTVPLLTEISSDYVAVDISREMIAACHRRYPEVSVVLGDARSLPFAAASFDLIVFSNNGIDSVGHSDRQRVLGDVHRVLASGGVFLFSTYNLDGPSARERPWTMPGFSLRRPRLSAARVKYRSRYLVRGLRNYRRLSKYRYDSGPGWSIRINGSHEFGIAIHHTTLRNQFLELDALGFEVLQVFSDDASKTLSPESATRNTWYFNFVCRKPDESLVRDDSVPTAGS